MTQAPPVTLAEFLRARLDEDEALLITGDCYCPPGVQQRPDCPDRIAAEVEAKRRIVELHGDRGDGRGCEQCATDAGGSDGFAWVIADDWPCETLRLLALPYADHPSYREEWAP